MIDETALRQAIYQGISEGMREGGAHLAEMFKRPDDGPKIEDVERDIFHGVTLGELVKALGVLARAHTYDGLGGRVYVKSAVAFGDVGDVLPAWTTVRRALGMPT